MKRFPSAIRFLRRFCPDDLLEAIEGDLLEKYEADLKYVSDRKAKQKLWWNVLRLIHPRIIFRNKMSFSKNRWALLANYLKVGRRNFWSDPFFSITNVLGLSVACAFTFLTLLYIQQEQSFDQFHENKENIFRLAQRISNAATGQLKDQSAVTAVPLSRDLANDMDNIVQFTRRASSNATIQIDDQYRLEKVHFVDPGFFKMFSFPIVHGPDEVTTEPGTVSISVNKARQLFGNTNVVGHQFTMTLGDSLIPMQIGAVIDAMETQSSIPFDILAPIELYQVTVSKQSFESYEYGLVENYIQLRSDVSPRQISKSMSSVMQKYVPQAERKTDWILQPFSTLYFEDVIVGNALYSSKQKIWILYALLFLVLFIAVVNYATMSVSQTLRRVDELAMRRTLGANGSQIWKQLVSESTLTVSLALTLGLVVAYLLLPSYTRMVGHIIDFRLGYKIVLGVAVSLVAIGITTATIQTILLTMRTNRQHLSAQMVMPQAKSQFSQLLVVFQFALCMILLLGSIYVGLQIKFIQEKDLGFNEELLVEITLDSDGIPSTAKEILHNFRTQAKRHPEILHVAGSMNNLSEPWTELVFDQVNGDKEKIYFNQISASYLHALDINLVAGQGFAPDEKANAQSILVNEALVEYFGWDNAIGRQIPAKNFTNDHQIIGVVNDYHFSSLHEKIKPLILALSDQPIRSGITGLSTYMWPPNIYRIYARLEPNRLDKSMALLESIWHDILPSKPFIYQFADDMLDERYASEIRWGRMADAACILALFIAWLGLIATVRLALQNRIKEIGMRKILGSSTLGIIMRVGKQYFIRVFLGCLLGMPIAWILIERWLNSFSYRVQISPIVLLLSFVGVLLLVIFSTTLQSYRIANRPPYRALQA